MIVVYAGLQRVASRAAARLPQLVVAAVVGGRGRGGTAISSVGISSR